MRLKRAGIITKLVVLALVIYASVTLLGLRGKIEGAKAAQAELQAQVADKAVENAQMKYAIDNKDNDEVIAEIARESLGLVKPGERVFYDSGK